MIKTIRGMFANAGESCWFWVGLLGLLPIGLMQKLFPGSGAAAAIGQWMFGILLLIPITGPLMILASLFDFLGGVKKKGFGK